MWSISRKGEFLDVLFPIDDGEHSADMDLEKSSFRLLGHVISIHSLYISTYVKDITPIFIHFNRDYYTAVTESE